MRLLLGKGKIGSLGTALLAACVFLFTGCSRGLLFVVTNVSAGSIQVKYKMKLSPSGLLMECDAPGVMPVSQLGTNQGWRELADSEYKLDRVNRVFEVSLKPQEILRIEVIGYLHDDDETTIARRFCVEEIEVTSNRGKLQFQGDEAYFAFKDEPSALRSLTYQ